MADSLINLAARIQLQNQILDTKINAWHHALTMIARVHKVFIEIYGLIPPIQSQK